MYGWSHLVMTSAQNWPKTAISSWRSHLKQLALYLSSFLHQWTRRDQWTASMNSEGSMNCINELGGIEKSEERFPMVKSTSTAVVTSLITHLIHKAHWWTDGQQPQMAPLYDTCRCPLIHEIALRCIASHQITSITYSASEVSVLSKSSTLFFLIFSSHFCIRLSICDAVCDTVTSSNLQPNILKAFSKLWAVFILTKRPCVFIGSEKS